MLLLPKMGWGQTKIAMPAAKVNFNELGKKKNYKQKFKAERLKNKVRSEEVRKMKKVMRKHTSLPKESVNNYASLITSLDSGEFLAFKNQFNAIQDQYNIPEVDYKNEYDKFDAEKAAKTVLANEKYQPLKPDDFPSVPDTSAFESIRSIHTIQQKLTKDSLDLNSSMNEFKSFPGIDSSAIQLPYDLKSTDSIFNQSGKGFSNEEMEGFLSSFVEERVALQKLETFASPAESMVSPVKQYIPGLEKFNYKKPEIPEEKLTEALLEQQKERKLEELKQSIGLKSEDQTEKRKVIERFEIGGYFQYQPAPERIELTPTLAYGISRKLAAGVGYNTSIPLQKDNEATRVKGYRVFLDYTFFKSYFAHTESEWLQQKSLLTEGDSLYERNIFLGLGKSIKYKKIKTSVLALYNFSAPNTFQTKKFTVRMGLTFSK